MLARLRCLAQGAALGALAHKGGQLLAQAIEEDPEPVRAFLGLNKVSTSDDTASADGAEPKPKKNVALVRMSGNIAAPSASALGDSGKINLSRFDAQLSSAFRTPNLAAVAIEINSPGGSPVQSALLFNRLRSLKEQHPNVPLLFFVQDVCASGGYYIASAADEIHVLPSSIVGSIGVVSPNVGVSELLRKHGIEDRTLTAGTSKAGDSPLKPVDPVATAHKKLLLEELHEDFKASVTAGRGNKLRHEAAAAIAKRCGDKKDRHARQEALFDGSVYAGRTAVSLGLADGLYDEMNATLKRRFGDDVRIFEKRGKGVGLLERLSVLQEANAEATAAALWRTASAELARGGDRVVA